MALTRELQSPLLSEDDVLRRAALLQLITRPSIEAAKNLIDALVYFLRKDPKVAETFEQALCTPGLAPLSEAPLLELLDDEREVIREEAAFLLFKLKIRQSSRERMAQALADDQSAWVRAYSAKALAVLCGPSVSPVLAEAIDNEATLEAIARMGEALALTGDPAAAAVLRDQAEQLREREPPADAEAPEQWARTAGQIALLFDALAAKLEGGADSDEADFEDDGTTFTYDHEQHGEVQVAGDRMFGGYVAQFDGDPAQRLCFDSPGALALLTPS